MMRTTILLTVVWLSMLSASAVYAQRIESSLDGSMDPAINCDGMSSSMYTKTTNHGDTRANAKVYKRFAVSRYNSSSSSEWSAAFVDCRMKFETDGYIWRLPTQRELMLMWVLKRELEQIHGFQAFEASAYWSATEDDSSSSWNVNFVTGFVLRPNKTSRASVRCVRELTP